MKVLKIPEEFLPIGRTIYPAHNRNDAIEDYAAKNLETLCINTDRIYVPIPWTEVHLRGCNKDNLQRWANSVASEHSSERFFTIVQHDLGIQIHFPRCLIFAAGGIGHIPIPLLCDAHPTQRVDKPKWLASFVGNIRNLCYVRDEMFDNLKDKQDIFLGENLGTEKFREVMSESIFALCPRGFGKTSFRLYEAIQIGAVPVYVYDDPWIPFENIVDWDSFSIMVHVKDISTLYDKMLNSIGRIDTMRNSLKQVYEKYFTMNGCCQMIKDILEMEYSWPFLR